MDGLSDQGLRLVLPAAVLVGFVLVVVRRQLALGRVLRLVWLTAAAASFGFIAIAGGLAFMTGDDRSLGQAILYLASGFGVAAMATVMIGIAASIGTLIGWIVIGGPWRSRPKS